nr:hypothetical protein [Salmonella sp.]
MAVMPGNQRNKCLYLFSHKSHFFYTHAFSIVGIAILNINQLTALSGATDINSIMVSSLERKKHARGEATVVTSKGAEGKDDF